VRRVIRALEVYEVTGELFSHQQRRQTPPYSFLTLGLTMERPALYRRVDERAAAMVQQGLVEEVRGLLAAGCGWDMPAMSSLGYAQFRDHLAGRQSLAEALARLQYDTHAFIRHQYTWFRRFKVERWVDAGNEEECRGVLEDVQIWLGKR
jgi:tRNA dimethylallyltransferase